MVMLDMVTFGPLLNACLLVGKRLPKKLERLLWRRCVEEPDSLAVFEVGSRQRYSRLLWVLRGRPMLRTVATIEFGDSLSVSSAWMVGSWPGSTRTRVYSSCSASLATSSISRLQLSCWADPVLR